MAELVRARFFKCLKTSQFHVQLFFVFLKDCRDGKKQKNQKKIWSSTKIGGKNNDKFAVKCQKQG